MEEKSMKRSIVKKTDKPADKVQNELLDDDSAWFDTMRATLSPYWSARLEHVPERPARSSDEEEAA